MTPELLESILTHARSTEDESCGLLISTGGVLANYYPCKNIAPDPSNHFQLDPEDWRDAEDSGRILGIVHSHPGGTAQPSLIDMTEQAASRLPWWIVVPETGKWRRFGASLAEGRGYAWGVEDCFSTVRDQLAIEFDCLRSPGFWHHADLWTRHMADAGFRVVDGPAEPGDVLFFAMGSTAINHCAVYLGNDEMLHHQTGRLSAKEQVGRWWPHLKQIARRA